MIKELKDFLFKGKKKTIFAMFYLKHCKDGYYRKQYHRKEEP